MRKIITSLFLFSFALCTQAQQLPNGNFESWKGDGNAGNTYQSSNGNEMRKRPGDEPSSWNGSSINQKVKVFVANVEKTETLIFKSASASYNGSTAVKMQNKWVGAAGIGSNAPAFITFATPWVYAVSTVSQCDGGAYGGISFTHRPDAIKGWFNRTGGTGEAAHIIVYLWNGTFKSNVKSSASEDVKDDTDRAVMGKESNLVQSGTLVASCDYTFTTTNGWQEITVPLSYKNNGIPEKLNVIISSGDYWTRDNVKDGSTLEVDDIQFVYYSELASLNYDGKNYFVKGQSAYSIDADYDASKLSVTSNGQGATIEKSFNESTKVLTIKVKGNDYASNSSNVHTYTIQFKKETVTPNPDPDPNPEPEPDPGTGDVDYTPAFTGEKTKLDRWITGVTMIAESYVDDEANTLQVDNSSNLCYNDYSDSVVMKAVAGETARVLLDIGDASWMNAYLYVDAGSDGFTASIAEGSNWQPAGDLVSYSFYNNGADSDAGGWNSAGESVSGNNRSTVTLPSFVVPSTAGRYRVRAKLDWCNIDPAGDQDGKFGDFMDNGGQIVDFMLEVIMNETVEPEPDPDPTPEPGDVDYTPVNTGTRNYAERNITAVRLVSPVHGESVYELSSEEQLEEYLDITGKESWLVAAPGEQVTFEVVTEGSWVNHYIYVDFASDGFAASIEEGSNWAPAGDLVAYSFYNNGGSSDNSGWNSIGDAISGDSRSKPVLPAFAVPSETGSYRMRIKQDWCSIDPAGDSDSNFGGTFSNYGGQIIDVILVVTSETGIDEVMGENSSPKAVYDLQGRRVENPVGGIYVIDGKKVLIK